MTRFDAFVGNPPFAGKNAIAEAGGDEYVGWLQAAHAGAHGNADLSAHFFRRAHDLLGKHGTVGFIATNTIGQGDTRATGLQQAARDDSQIYEATRSMPWPGAANVSVSVVHLAKGSTRRRVGCRLDGRVVDCINSRLQGKPERPDPVALIANAEGAFVGTYINGVGFTLTRSERESLISKDPRNGQLLNPYIGGEEVNTSPTQNFDRYVINFGQMTLDEAERWPDLLAIVREKVKPERDKNAVEKMRRQWWQFYQPAIGLYAIIRRQRRCLVTSQVTKHLCLSFQPTGCVFGHTCYVFPFADHAPFALLQSRIHEVWARLLSSSMRADLRYSASDAFGTFPFPPDVALSPTSALEAVGERLYASRAKYMVDENVGLTTTYNRLKDPRVQDARVRELRRLHEEMDHAVLDAYGWSDIAVPPFGTPAESAAFEAFSDKVLDRLFALNEQRAAEERLTHR